MNAGFRLQQPQVYGSRTIIPVVHEIVLSHGNGMAASVRPVALLIGEEGEWGVALLEGDSIAALVEDILLL
jgi:hypothetical protein